MRLFLRQDALGGAQFLQRRDHREHDVQVGQRSRAQDGAELGAEHRRLVEADPDAAQSQEGVFLFRERQVGQRLVAADIQGADDQRTATAEHFGDGAVGSGLLVLAWGLIALVEQELGAQQSDTLAAGGDRRQGVVGVADIGDDFDPVAVAGLRRLHRGRQFLPAALGASGDLFAGAGDFRLVRVAAEHAASAVEQDLGAVVEVQGRFVDAADRGNAERAGDDRDVAGGAAAGGAEAQDAGPVDRGDIGGGQVLGDQDGVLRDFDPLLLDPGEQAQDPPADVADVGGALAEQGIVEAFQLLGVAGEGFPPRIGGAGAARDAVERQIERSGSSRSSLWASRIFALEGSLHVPLQFLDLGAGLGQGGVELAALVGGCAAFLVHFDHVVAVLEDLADGETGRGRDAGDLVGVGRDGAGRLRRRLAAGCGSSPGFSPQPSAIREARAATALSASGPVALTVTTSPCLVDRPMIATRDLALTLSSPRISWIWELKVFAAAASTAAGRACSPAGFGRGMPSDRASAPGAAASATVIPAAPVLLRPRLRPSA